MATKFLYSRDSSVFGEERHQVFAALPKSTGQKKLIDEECIDHDYVKIIYRGIQRIFSTKVPCFAMDMGVFYLFIEHIMCQEAFLKNCCELAEFELCNYAYDIHNRYVRYSKHGMQKKVVGFLNDLHKFIIWRKITFTSNRYHALTSTEFANLERDRTLEIRLKLSPWHPMQFMN